jgi:ABC-type multidrug transport system fused ATPase/permease subunit
LPAGEMTEIGARGINLSGGQRSRTALARALYAEESKILLLDDPLSAVDAHVGEHIFSKAIAGELAAGKTRILVTHQVHLLSRCDSIIVLENGRIKHHGKYEDLLRQGVSFAGAIDVKRNTATRSSAKGNDKDKVQDVEQTDEAKAKLKQSGKKLVKEEEREEGSVAGSAYFHYARAGGIVVASATFVIQGIGRASEVLSGFWLALWAERAFRADQEGEPFSKGTTNFYVGIYAVFGLVGVLGLTLRAIAIAIHRLRASKQLHNDLTERILRAPVAFFDVTPVGRILNRFAADMDKVDLELTQSLSQGISTIFNVLGAIGGMIAATKGAFLVPMIPIGYLYYTIQKWFRQSSTELQRINSIANSPIFADFSQVLSGTSTIRAYGEEQRFFQQCQESFDTMNASYILVQMTNYWLGLRLDVLGGLMGAFIGGVAVATSSHNFISPGWLGLALTYSIEVTAYLKHGIRMIATIEAQMNSVERILFYTQKIDIEAAEQLPSDPPPTKWPESGAIEIRHASMRYRDGPLVLKDVSIRINAGEKIGICGRTGSGKSSLMVALFRLSELEKDGGAILIDGVDITAIGTSTLRLNMSIIPQDPVIFSNSVRYNLDPFEQCSDDELWEVLKQVELFDVISALQEGLYYQVAEGGENFSQGQRQLLCIARALLRKSKLLVMDEATASIDNATDATIQKMIRENFRDATVLTIAHRLNTILDSDRVLVLDDGRVAEFDAPDVLMEEEDSLFRIMVEKSREAKGKGLTE